MFRLQTRSKVTVEPGLSSNPAQRAFATSPTGAVPFQGELRRSFNLRTYTQITGSIQPPTSLSGTVAAVDEEIRGTSRFSAAVAVLTSGT